MTMKFYGIDMFAGEQTNLVIIPAGSVMIFGNESAPTGWTKKTDWQNNSMLIFTTDSTSDSGGLESAKNMTGAAAGGHNHDLGSHTHTISAEALTTDQMPSHSHGFIYPTTGTWVGPPRGVSSNTSSADGVLDGSMKITGYDRSAISFSIADTGGGLTHDHSGNTGVVTGNTSSVLDHTHTISPYYQTVIAAIKN